MKLLLQIVLVYASIEYGEESYMLFATLFLVKYAKVVVVLGSCVVCARREYCGTIMVSVQGVDLV